MSVKALGNQNKKVYDLLSIDSEGEELDEEQRRKAFLGTEKIDKVLSE
jgi:hypothetical protein